MQNKTFRLFVSSTFSDFNEERKLLQTKVFPEIKKYCSSKGLNFQPIDLRWGVSNEAQLDQKTLELCLDEVKSSKTNPHPNFLIMAGDRYGWIPLPYLIEQKEFETLLENIEDSEDKTLLQNWYKLDLNQLPASYILNERKDEFEKYEAWEKVETKLRNTLQNAVLKSSIEENEKKKYFTSATEAEVVEGIFKYLDKTKFQEELSQKDKDLEDIDYENVYAYIRNINSVSNLEDRFKDCDLNEVQRFKEEIKKSILSENVYEVNTDIKNISQDEKNYSLNYEYKELESDFTNKIYSYLKSSIDKYLENIKEYSKEELEKFEQIRFKNDKLKDFLKGSRTNALNKIDEYISSDNNEALVIYGKSGLGKSSLMAKAIEETQTKYKDSKKLTYRFVGSTSNLSSSVDLLISILKELGINEEVRKVINPQTGQEEAEKLEDFYLRIHDHFLNIQNQTIIFIDAIDQINNEDIFIWLPNNLSSNLKIIISVLDDENYEEDSKYFNILKEKSNNLYALEEFEDAEKLVQNMLSKYNRTISKTQMDYLLNIYKNIKTPLYLSVAVQELRHWKSEDNTQTLANSQKGIIQEFIENLTKLYHHDKEFVKRVFSYLYLSDGLSESELLEVLNIDEEFIKQIAPDTYHNNLSNELPVVIWARLHTQLKDFLKLENKDKQVTMSFFHREFNEVIRNQDDIKLIHEKLLTDLYQEMLNREIDFYLKRFEKIFFYVLASYHIEYEFTLKLYTSCKLSEHLKNLPRYLNIEVLIDEINTQSILRFVYIKIRTLLTSMDEEQKKSFKIHTFGEYLGEVLSLDNKEIIDYEFLINEYIRFFTILRSNFTQIINDKQKSIEKFINDGFDNFKEFTPEILLIEDFMIYFISIYSNNDFRENINQFDSEIIFKFRESFLDFILNVALRHDFRLSMIFIIQLYNMYTFLFETYSFSNNYDNSKEIKLLGIILDSSKPDDKLKYFQRYQLLFSDDLKNNKIDNSNIHHDILRLFKFDKQGYYHSLLKVLNIIIVSSSDEIRSILKELDKVGFLEYLSSIISTMSNVEINYLIKLNSDIADYYFMKKDYLNAYNYLKYNLHSIHDKLPTDFKFNYKESKEENLDITVWNLYTCLCELINSNEDTSSDEYYTSILTCLDYVKFALSLKNEHSTGFKFKDYYYLIELSKLYIEKFDNSKKIDFYEKYNICFIEFYEKYNLVVKYMDQEIKLNKSYFDKKLYDLYIANELHDKVFNLLANNFPLFKFSGIKEKRTKILNGILDDYRSDINYFMESLNNDIIEASQYFLDINQPFSAILLLEEFVRISDKFINPIHQARLTKLHIILLTLYLKLDSRKYNFKIIYLLNKVKTISKFDRHINYEKDIAKLESEINSELIELLNVYNSKPRYIDQNIENLYKSLGGK